jgi:hypothetical protein
LDTSLIYQALEQPSLRKQIPIEELERIQATYPYFTAAQVLLAKIYQENQDHRYADQLQQAALYAIDRKVLSEYMKGEQNENEKQNENELRGESENEKMGKWGNGEETVQNEPIRQAQGPFQNENEKQNENELRGERENQNQKQNENELREERENEKVGKWENGETEKEQNEPVRQAQGPEQNEKQNENENELSGENQVRVDREILEMSDFDRQLLIEAVHSSIELEVGEESEEEGLSTGSDTEQNENQKQNENELRGENEEEIRRIEAKDPSELTFGELMMLKAARMETKQNDNEKQNVNELRGENEEEEEEIRLSTNEERTEERGKNFDYLYKLHNGGLAPIDAPNEKEKQKSIIDRFIKLEPKITPGKVSEYNTASNLAKESLEEDFSFATETMAKLFIAQGKFDKAKKVYRKLMELHPEKNVYFAAQLKNLNQNKKQ